ncbi:MAG TPA: Crp/Fnr family transcriptional regulator [Syntrophobacteraceae bacterium]|nr:Crp/Fnr family transcriptional regulator [Syntrophobacteraceae bacterium]
MNSPLDHEKACELDAGGRSRCELDENLDILRGVAMFSSIPIERLRLYAYLSTRMRYGTGEFVFRQWECGNLGYVVIHGKAQVIRELKDYSVFLHEFQEGDFFGGFALFSEVPRLFSVRAATDLECLTMNRETFQKLFVQFPEVGIKMLNVLVRRFVLMEEKLIQAGAEECTCS